MRILFICGSMEPGRDGVGDYVRRLAAELIHQGHEAEVLALCEPFLEQPLQQAQNFESTSVQVLRLPSAWPSYKKMYMASDFVKRFDPEWLSLQMVLFSFHRKGLPFGLARQLQYLGKGRSWHIMFHELWVGMELHAGRKMVCWGWMQKQLIRILLGTLKPFSVHTQTGLYQQQLLAIGSPAGHLPLFANIPRVNKIDNIQGDMCSENVSSKTISLVLFGAIHPGAPVVELAMDAARLVQENGMQVSLTLIGRSGAEQEHWVRTWTRMALPVRVMGEQSPNRISSVLSKATLGISTNRLALVEKSGTVAAMLEHGLPVICVSGPWKARGFQFIASPKGIREYVPGNLESLVQMKHDIPKQMDVREITQKFLSGLSLSKHQTRNEAARFDTKQVVAR
jgi:hypothetical protein